MLTCVFICVRPCVCTFVFVFMCMCVRACVCFRAFLLTCISAFVMACMSVRGRPMRVRGAHLRFSCGMRAVLGRAGLRAAAIARGLISGVFSI